MGRGRAKAKQTKVARELKYYTPNTDLSALQRELGVPGQERHVAPPVDADDTDDTPDDGDELSDWAANGRR